MNYLNFFVSVIMAAIPGYSLPANYAQVVSPFINHFFDHITMIEFLLPVAIILYIALRRFGTRFLVGIKSLPPTLYLQRLCCQILQLIDICAIAALIAYAIVVFLAGIIGEGSGFVTLFAARLTPVLYGLIPTVFIGFILNWYILSKIEPYYSKKINKNIQKKDTSGLTDIRTLAMPGAKDFDPEKYFKPGQICLGVDIENNPLYITAEKFFSAHTQIQGKTGTGKGVGAACMNAQCLLNGAANFIFDVKKGGDDWAPSVMSAMCEKMDKKFYLLDLRSTTDPQINLIENISAEDLTELLEVGFELEDGGGDSDFYKGDERRMTVFAQDFVDEAKSLPHLFELLKEHRAEEFADAKGLFNKMEAICRRMAIQTSEGINLSEIIKNGDCVYIKGSYNIMDIKRLQRMILLRIKQLVENRDTSKKQRQVTIFLDEIKFVLSRPVMDSLSLIRSHKCNIILAHQGPTDLKDVSKNINAEVCYGTIVTNSGIKLLYGLTTPEDLEKVSRLTGTVIAQRTSRTTKSNKGMGQITETDANHKMDTQVPLFDENHLISLQERVGILIGIGIPQLCFTSHIRVGKRKIENYRSTHFKVDMMDKKDMIKGIRASSNAVKNQDKKSAESYQIPARKDRQELNSSLDNDFLAEQELLNGDDL